MRSVKEYSNVKLPFFIREKIEGSLVNNTGAIHMPDSRIYVDPYVRPARRISTRPYNVVNSDLAKLDSIRCVLFIIHVPNYDKTDVNFMKMPNIMFLDSTILQSICLSDLCCLCADYAFLTFIILYRQNQDGNYIDIYELHFN